MACGLFLNSRNSKGLVTIPDWLREFAKDWTNTKHLPIRHWVALLEKEILLVLVEFFIGSGCTLYRLKYITSAIIIVSCEETG